MGRRAALDSVDYDRSAHPGLLLDIALSAHDSSAREQVFKDAKSALNRVKDLYRMAFDRRDRLIGGRCALRDLRTTNRLVCGLGIESSLETGLRLHHTYGTPLIPGSSIKGLCAHYCAEICAQQDPSFAPDGEIYKTMFGEQDDKGKLIFEDAWILPNSVTSSLVEDVMTPIRPKYYGGTGAPNDCLNPIPVTFLSVRGTFRFYVRPENLQDPLALQWAEYGLQLCCQAVSLWGIGGKTRAGYGRMRA